MGWPPEEVREEAVRCPADMIAYGDSFTGALYLAPSGTNRFSWTNGASVPSSRHRGGANLLFSEVMWNMENRLGGLRRLTGRVANGTATTNLIQKRGDGRAAVRITGPTNAR